MCNGRGTAPRGNLRDYAYSGVHEKGNLMRIALAQPDPVVGDIAGNTEKIVADIDAAHAQGAALVVFPELAVCGYPPKDLLLKPAFVRANREAVERIAERCKGIAALVGFVEENTASVGLHLHNSAALCADGRIVSTHRKSLLPTYDVFDERRYFEPGSEVEVVTVADEQIGVSICEDLWNDEQFVGRRIYRDDPIAGLVAKGARVLVNMSASPFAVGKQQFREELYGAQAERHGVPLLVVNQVGGNDELVFDGASMAFDAGGRVVARAKPFAEDLLVVDLANAQANRLESYPGEVAAVHDALVLGVNDYVRKCAFTEVVVGLSGGIDSAVTAAVATAALGPSAVHGVAMPSRYSSQHSIDDARAVADNLSIECRVVPIGGIHQTYEDELAPQFAGRGPDITEENIQARIRGNILMALSNKLGWLLLSTGNKSELAVGYCTLYGDMCGGLAVISDVPKAMVYAVARHINERAGRELIPESTLTKPPSAELRPDQTDQDSLPPYEVLDRILEAYVERERSFDEIVADGFDPDVVRDVLNKVDCNEYKRKQAALGLRVTSRAFGFGRRMPIAARYG